MDQTPEDIGHMGEVEFTLVGRVVLIQRTAQASCAVRSGGSSAFWCMRLLRRERGIERRVRAKIYEDHPLEPDAMESR
jgi:hypothetical protein